MAVTLGRRRIRELFDRFTSVAISGDGDTLVAASKTSGIAGGGIFFSTAPFSDGGTWAPAGGPTGDVASVTVSGDGAKLAAAVSGGTIYTAIRVIAEDGTGKVSWIWTERWTDQEGETSNTKRAWSAVAYSADGKKLVAADSLGFIYVSADDGATWKRASAPSYRWKTVAASADGRVLIAAADQGVSAARHSRPSSPLTSARPGHRRHLVHELCLEVRGRLG